MLNVFQPDLGEREAEAVREVFASNWIGKGPKVAAFEAAFAAHLDVPADAVIALNNCTEGLFLTMELLGVGSGDEVILPSISFVGLGNAIMATGARPVFCDVDPETLNPRPEHIEERITPATRAVALLHYGGAPGWVDDIAELTRSRGIPLLEDTAIAVGSTVDSQACGTFGDFATWSFDAGKILVTIDGGMLYVKDPALRERARRRAYLGMRQTAGFSQAKDGQDRWWEFDVESHGRRSVSNDVSAAIGLVQLDRLPGFLDARAKVAGWYDEALDGIDAVRARPAIAANQVQSNYMYWIQAADADARDVIARTLYERDIYTTFRYLPLHTVAYYGAVDADLPGTDHGASRTLVLPMHHRLTESDVGRVADGLREAARRLYGTATPPAT